MTSTDTATTAPDAGPPPIPAPRAKPRRPRPSKRVDPPTEPVVLVPESPVTVYGFRFDPEFEPIGAGLAAETLAGAT